MASAADRAANIADANLRRLGTLAAPVADELLAAWSDPALAGRLIEQWLGGERDVDLDHDTLLTLVRLYEYLEDLRLVAPPEPEAAPRSSQAGT